VWELVVENSVIEFSDNCTFLESFEESLDLVEITIETIELSCESSFESLELIFTDFFCFELELSIIYLLLNLFLEFNFTCLIDVLEFSESFLSFIFINISDEV